MVTRKRSFRCATCSREFRRHEHLRRHARIHTQEKPFACACGQAFSRQDLLRRHEKKLATKACHRVHSNPATSVEVDVGVQMNTPPLSDPIALEEDMHLSEVLQDNCNGSAGANSGDATLLEPNLGTSAGSALETSPISGHDSLGWLLPESDWTLDNSNVFDTNFMLPSDVDLSSCLLLDDFDISETSLLRQAISSADLNTNDPGSAIDAGLHGESSDVRHESSISRFGSPLPSLPEKALHETSKSSTPRRPRQGKLIHQEYVGISDRLQQLIHVVPPNFCLPSRETLSRYLRGYLKGLNEHFPILHTPTFSVARTSLPTLLSMAAIGAHWCFEAKPAESLFFATKSIIMYSLDDGAALLARHSDDRAHLRLQILQALLNLIVAGTWGSARLLREALGLQSIAATLARELGLKEDKRTEEIMKSSMSIQDRWHLWVGMESRRRTLLMVYSYFNVMCLAYDIPPLILSSEIGLDMPESPSLWSAETAHEWQENYEATSAPPRKSFQECMDSLFAGVPSRHDGAFTPLDNYISILALLQRIFFLRQSWTALPKAGEPIADADEPEMPGTSTMRAALHRWQAHWERSPDSIVESPTWTGPIPFTSTAFLRLAWIRLSADFGPCRNLASRDTHLITDAFLKAPRVRRTSQVTMPILQAVYALAVPVQTGVEFVARAQTVSWSVQHFLCNFECAIFLSKWLEELAATVSLRPLSTDESKLVALLRSMMRETSLFYDDDGFAKLVPTSAIVSKQVIAMLAAAVAKVWAKIFQGTFAFPFANTVATSLQMYAERMESAVLHEI